MLAEIMPMQFPERDLVRLSGYDYSRPGFYFVTACVSRRECLLRAVVDGTMKQNAMGDIVSRVWQDLPKHYLNIVLDAFVVMPIIFTVSFGSLIYLTFRLRLRI
jgi:hypothetical protein